MSPSVERASTNKFLWRAAIYWILSVFVGIGGMVVMPNLRIQRISLEKNYEMIMANNKLLKENAVYLERLTSDMKRIVEITHGAKAEAESGTE